ncbi:MAG TPA: 50S ribosomal protein L17 [Candidatus Latescibacteria bacterium]|nr:50S ribosomal protein L17 [Candidatus Latescibacterota bacterium]
MRHRKKGRKLGRTTSHRKAMLRNMVTSLIENEAITTTDAKAKELKPLAEKMISLARKGDLHSRRQALAVIRGKKTVSKLFNSIAPRYAGREGGYVRIYKLGERKGDGAPISLVELIGREKEAKGSAKKSESAK